MALYQPVYPSHFSVDTEAEKNIYWHEGSICYVRDTDKFYVLDKGAWILVGGSGVDNTKYVYFVVPESSLTTGTDKTGRIYIDFDGTITEVHACVSTAPIAWSSSSSNSSHSSSSSSNSSSHSSSSHSSSSHSSSSHSSSSHSSSHSSSSHSSSSHSSSHSSSSSNSSATPSSSHSSSSHSSSSQSSSHSSSHSSSSRSSSHSSSSHSSSSHSSSSFTYKALLHMNGTDGSQTFTDEGGHTFSVNSTDAQIDTTLTDAFGGHSGVGQFDGSDYITTGDSDDWDLGTGNFTIDFWVYPTSLTGYCGIIGTAYQDTSGEAWTIYTVNDGVVKLTDDGANTTKVTSGDKSITTNQWNHVAIVRKGTGSTDLNIYINGEAGNAPASGNVTLNSRDQGLVIGRFRISGALHYFTGYLDEVRVAKGEATWTSNFTPPTSPY